VLTSALRCRCRWRTSASAAAAQRARSSLEGNIRLEGRLPINTAGGLPSEAYIHGLNLVTEAVRQLRGTSTAQVPGAKTCLVTGGLGSTPTSAAILAV